MSISISRSLYTPATSVLRLRPSVRSICCVISNNSRGERIVSTRHTAFKNAFSLSKPKGSVSIKEDTASTEPTRRAISSYASCKLRNLSPRLVPSDKYTICCSLFISHSESTWHHHKYRSGNLPVQLRRKPS